MCILILTFFLIAGCSLSNREKYISKYIEANVDDCTILKEWDTHSGFLGDGEYFAKLKCSNSDSLKFSSNWKKLPLPNIIQDILDIKWCDDANCLNFWEKYDVIKSNSGYYFFLNRHFDVKNKYDVEELMNNVSYNFTLAIFEQDSNTIYYYEIDT